MADVLRKLLDIQTELKAPKNQYNSFGNYKYRSAEDILEAVKPLCKNHGAVLTVADELVMVGDRFYVKATATLAALEGGEVSACAYAREDAQKKGMDGSQVTGAASSYARKYALNGLFCIDDTKDADGHNGNQQEDVPDFVAELDTEKELTDKWVGAGYKREQLAPAFEKKYGVSLAKATVAQMRKAIIDLEEKKKQKSQSM